MSRSYPVTLIFPDDEEITFQVNTGESILDAAMREGLTLPFTCLQGWCLTCAGRVLEGEWDQSESLRYYDQDKEGSFILLCTAYPKSAMRIATHQKATMKEHRTDHHLPTPRG